MSLGLGESLTPPILGGQTDACVLGKEHAHQTMHPVLRVRVSYTILQDDDSFGSVLGARRSGGLGSFPLALSEPCSLRMEPGHLLAHPRCYHRPFRPSQGAFLNAGL